MVYVPPPSRRMTKRHVKTWRLDPVRGAAPESAGVCRQHNAGRQLTVFSSRPRLSRREYLEGRKRHAHRRGTPKRFSWRSGISCAIRERYTKAVFGHQRQRWSMRVLDLRDVECSERRRDQRLVLGMRRQRRFRLLSCARAQSLPARKAPRASSLILTPFAWRRRAKPRARTTIRISAVGCDLSKAGNEDTVSQTLLASP